MPELLVLTAVIPIFAASEPQDVFRDAEWLRNPVFEGVPVIDIYHKENAERPDLSGPRNVHTLFRRQIELPQKPADACLYVTGDDYYKLYINGEFVVQGPEPGYPFAHPYYELAVTDHLRAGMNTLASHVYYQGLCNRVWNSADNRSGFIMALEVTFENGETKRYVTDDSWRCHRCEAFPTGRTIGYDTQFAEDIDMRKIPRGWRDAEFDDSGWVKPLTGRQDHRFVKQITSPLQIYSVRPVVAKRKAQGNYFYDFGTEIVGHTRIRIKGPRGHRIEVRHGEELIEPDTVRFDMRANCKYQEFPVLSGADDTIEFYDYRGFRYIEVLDAPSEPDVRVDVRHHPFDPSATVLETSDSLLQDIWRICKNGVRYSAQGGFLDCPTREKGQYLGDALITGHSHMLLTGDGSLMKKALKDFQLSQRICPGIMAVAPGSFMQEIAEHSLQWTLAVREYYRQTGDRLFTERITAAAFDKLYGYFADYENDAGLLTGMDEKWVLVDWPKNLRDDYDYDYAEKRENAVLNAFYYASLEAAAGLLRDFADDHEAERYEAKARRVKEAFAERLLDKDSGLFLDAPGSDHSSLHANALPLAFGLVAPENVPEVVELIRKKRLSCGVYIASFVIGACFEAGRPALGYDLLTSKDKHSWHEMLEHGATTCMEAWGPDQKWNTSWCHPWSSSPIYLVVENVLGLTPAKPGWRAVSFKPRVPESLDRIDLKLPTPLGPIKLEYDAAKGFDLTVPPGVPVQTDLPDGATLRIHDTKPLESDQLRLLERYDWSGRVGQDAGLWVSIRDQRLRIIQGGHVAWEVPCSTAANGPGNEINSYKTPLGWHSVAQKVGDGAPWGQVFTGRKKTGEIWQPRQGLPPEDLVLTRILVLQGEEPGKNKGGDIDSLARHIYIHGTAEEHLIGKPASRGCVRLRNDDVIAAFQKIPEGTPVLITEF